MFFHADRNVKDNLLQMYKQDAQDYTQRKNDLKTKRLNEERDYLESVSKREQQQEQQRRQEKFRRINETMG